MMKKLTTHAMVNKSTKKSIDEDKTEWILFDCTVIDKYDHLLVIWNNDTTQEIVPNSPSDYNDCREELTRMELYGDALSNAGWEDGAGNPVELKPPLSAHELRDMANSLYDGGWRHNDLYDMMVQFNSEGLTREEAKKICEILGEIESRTEKSITPIKSFNSMVKSQRSKNSMSKNRDEGFYKFIEVNEDYFRYLVDTCPFEEVHGYVEQQLDWYLGKHPDDDSWTEMHEKMGNVKVEYDWFNDMARFIWNTYKIY